MNDVSLIEMLNAREQRYCTQQRLLKSYPCTLICFTMNIPGPVKLLAGVPEAFEKGCSLIERCLKEHQIAVQHREIVKQKTGCEAFYCVSAAPESVKELMIGLEDQNRQSRLFDLDVFRPDGTHLSREELGHAPRTCLLCEQPAHACSRSRRHSVEELVSEITRLLAEFREE